MPSSPNLDQVIAQVLGSSGPTSNPVSRAFTSAAGATAGSTLFDSWVQAIGLTLNAEPYQGARYFGTAHSPQPAVYMGMGKKGNVPASITHTFNPATGSKEGVVESAQTIPASAQLLSVRDAEQLPATWSEGQVMDAMAKMQAAGFPVHSYDDVVNLWKSMVARASDALMASGGTNKMTPWDALSLYGQENAAAGIGPGGSHTTTNVSRSVSNIDQGEAWNALQGTLSQMLGRDPTDNELRDFVHRMNHLAVRNPSVTHSTTTTDAKGNTTSSSHTTPGFTAADMAQSAYYQAQQEPDYGAYQAGSTYFNAALSALGALGNAGSNA